MHLSNSCGSVDETTHKTLNAVLKHSNDIFKHTDTASFELDSIIKFIMFVIAEIQRVKGIIIDSNIHGDMFSMLCQWLKPNNDEIIPWCIGFALLSCNMALLCLVKQEEQQKFWETKFDPSFLQILHQHKNDTSVLGIILSSLALIIEIIPPYEFSLMIKEGNNCLLNVVLCALESLDQLPLKTDLYSILNVLLDLLDKLHNDAHLGEQGVSARNQLMKSVVGLNWGILIGAISDKEMSITVKCLIFQLLKLVISDTPSFLSNERISLHCIFEWFKHYFYESFTLLQVTVYERTREYDNCFRTLVHIQDVAICASSSMPTNNIHLFQFMETNDYFLSILHQSTSVSDMKMALELLEIYCSMLRCTFATCNNLPSFSNAVVPLEIIQIFVTRIRSLDKDDQQSIQSIASMCECINVLMHHIVPYPLTDGFDDVLKSVGSMMMDLVIYKEGDSVSDATTLQACKILTVICKQYEGEKLPFDLNFGNENHSNLIDILLSKSTCHQHHEIVESIISLFNSKQGKGYCEAIDHEMLWQHAISVMNIVVNDMHAGRCQVIRFIFDVLLILIDNQQYPYNQRRCISYSKEVTEQLLSIMNHVLAETSFTDDCAMVRRCCRILYQMLGGLKVKVTHFSSTTTLIVLDLMSQLTPLISKYVEDQETIHFLCIALETLADRCGGSHGVQDNRMCSVLLNCYEEAVMVVSKIACDIDPLHEGSWSTIQELLSFSAKLGAEYDIISEALNTNVNPIKSNDMNWIELFLAILKPKSNVYFTDAVMLHTLIKLCDVRDICHCITNAFTDINQLRVAKTLLQAVVALLSDCNQSINLITLPCEMLAKLSSIYVSDPNTVEYGLQILMELLVDDNMEVMMNLLSITTEYKHDATIVSSIVSLLESVCVRDDNNPTICIVLRAFTDVNGIDSSSGNNSLFLVEYLVKLLQLYNNKPQCCRSTTLIMKLCTLLTRILSVVAMDSFDLVMNNDTRTLLQQWRESFTKLHCDEEVRDSLIHCIDSLSVPVCAPVKEESIEISSSTTCAEKLDIKVISNKELNVLALLDVNVYKSQWRTCTTVAVKIKRCGTHRATNLLHEEMKHFRSLHHPRILSTLGICNDFQIQGESNTGLILEYMEQGNLRTVLNAQFELLSWSQKLVFAMDICEGMNFVHSSNLTHGKLCSNTVLIDNNGRVKLTGFTTTPTPIVKKETMVLQTKKKENGKKKKKNSLVTTVPEDNKHHDPKEDIFNFGVILWELITGKQVPWNDQSQASKKGHKLTLTEKESQGSLSIITTMMNKCLAIKGSERPSFDGLMMTLQQLYQQQVVSSKRKGIPDGFICPITQDIMKDPVMLTDGHTYERHAIVDWLRKSNRSPLTNEILSDRTTMFPNFALKASIESFMKENPGVK